MPRKLLCLRYMEPQKPQLFLMTYFVCPFQIHEFHLIWRYTRQMGYFFILKDCCKANDAVASI